MWIVQFNGEKVIFSELHLALQYLSLMTQHDGDFMRNAMNTVDKYSIVIQYEVD